MVLLRLYVVALLGTALVGCAPDSNRGGDADAATANDAAGDTPADVEPPVCAPSSRYTPGTAMFREATTLLGLDVKGVYGTRINAVDVNGDGYADLLVRRGGALTDQSVDPETRRPWLLINQQGRGFVDATLESGLLDTRGNYAGALEHPVDVVAFADVDNDGDLDLYNGIPTRGPASTDLETSEVLINNGDGVFGFTRADNDIRRDGAVDAPAGASFVDFDADGIIDLWVGQHNYTAPGGDTVFQSDRLYRGLGDGTFEDVSDAAGITTEDWVNVDTINNAQAHSRAWSATACDLNNDGRDELLVASYGRAPNHLWRAEADGRFTNVSVASGYAYDSNFEWRDNEFARCFCASNRDAEECADVDAPQIGCAANWSHTNDREPFRLGGNSGTTVCADIDNDGFFDLMTTEIRHWWAGSGADGSDILFNTGEADIRLERADRGEIGFVIPHVTRGGWDEGHMTATTLDFDNDGWLDLYVGASDYAGNRGLLFHQVAPRRFELVSVDDSFEHNRSHGVAVADFDRDGDLDIVVGHSRSRCDAGAPNDCYELPQLRYFENIAGQSGNWLQVRVDGGDNFNRAGIGAIVEVVADGITQTRRIDGGYGHYGAQNELVAHFGLGDACRAEVTVIYPPATTGTTHVIDAGARYVVVGDGPPERD